MKLGYARVSTKTQKLDFQIDALKQAGCEKIFTDIISGAKSERPNLNEMRKHLRSGDTVIVYKLDRLGRSLKDLISIVNHFLENDITLKSLSDNIDLGSSQGKLIFNIFSSLAEFERDLIRERTKAGLDAARARGRVGGRPKGLSSKAHDVACIAEILYKERKLSIRQIVEHLHISKRTLYNYLRYRNVQIGSYKKAE